MIGAGNMNNIKIAKQLIKLAKSMIAYGDEESQINDIINSDLKNNPVMAINQIEQVLDDDEFSSLVKQVKSASMRTAYIDDLGILDKVQQKVKQAETFGKKLIRFCKGKPKHIIAAAGAVFYAYLHVNIIDKMGFLELAVKNNVQPESGFQMPKYVLDSAGSLFGLLSIAVGFIMAPAIYRAIKCTIENIAYEVYRLKRQEQQK